MEWSDVGNWLKTNAGTGAALVGSLLTGNVPAAIAAGVSLVSSATGESNPEKVLESLQSDPAAVLKLRELAIQEQESIRENIRLTEEMRLKDEQAAHKEQQDTIRSGDSSTDEYVRHTRPLMARQSWYSTILYVMVFEGLHVWNLGGGANWEMATILVSPAAAYMGFRTWDKLKRK